jgi:hypothetical protein
MRDRAHALARLHDGRVKTDCCIAARNHPSWRIRGRNGFRQ